MASFEMDGSWRLPLGPIPNVFCHESQGEFQKHGLVSHRILEWLEFWVIMTIRNNHYLWKLAWGQPRLQGDVRRAVNSALRVETHFQMGFLFSRIPPPKKVKVVDLTPDRHPVSLVLQQRKWYLSSHFRGHLHKREGLDAFALCTTADPKQNHLICLQSELGCPFVQFFILSDLSFWWGLPPLLFNVSLK